MTSRAKWGVFANQLADFFLIYIPWTHSVPRHPLLRFSRQEKGSRSPLMAQNRQPSLRATRFIPLFFFVVGYDAVNHLIRELIWLLYFIDSETFFCTSIFFIGIYLTIDHSWFNWELFFFLSGAQNDAVSYNGCSIRFNEIMLQVES